MHRVDVSNTKKIYFKSNEDNPWLLTIRIIGSLDEKGFQMPFIIYFNNFLTTFHDPKQQISGLKRKPSSTCSTSHPLEGRNQENYRTSVLQVREPGPGLAAVQTNTSHCVLAPPHWNLSVKLIRPLSQNKTLRIPSSSPIPSHGCQIKYRMPD